MERLKRCEVRHPTAPTAAGGAGGCWECCGSAADSWSSTEALPSLQAVTVRSGERAGAPRLQELLPPARDPAATSFGCPEFSLPKHGSCMAYASI